MEVRSSYSFLCLLIRASRSLLERTGNLIDNISFLCLLILSITLASYSLLIAGSFFERTGNLIDNISVLSITLASYRSLRCARCLQFLVVLLDLINDRVMI